MTPIAAKLTSAIFGVALALPACSGPDEQAVAQVKKPFGAGGTEKANAELEHAVKAALDSDAQVKAANLTIAADVTRNEVTLSGTVPSDALRQKALELAKSAHVGVLVTDRISIKPNTSNAAPPKRTAFA